MTVDEFKRKHKPKRVSDLEPFRKDIIELYESNFSQDSIRIFLLEKGVKTSRQNIGRFIRSLNKDLPAEQTNKTETEETTSESSPKKQFFNVDIKKKVGKSTELEKPDWL